MESQFLARAEVVTPDLEEKAKRVVADGFAVVESSDFAGIISPEQLASLAAFWDDLPLDEELVGGATFRERRYGRITLTAGEDGITAAALPHAPFQQAAEHIPIYGGRARVFAPAPPEALLHPAMLRLIGFDAYVVGAVSGITDWAVNLHLIRIVARADEPGLPTPEGRHRDGHLYIGMHMLGRRCQGGESIVYRDGAAPVRLTLQRPLDALIVDDGAVTHEVTPIGIGDGGRGIRDMLLVDLNPASAPGR